MIARDWSRGMGRWLVAVATVGATGSPALVHAQQGQAPPRSRAYTPPQQQPAADPGPAKVRLPQADQIQAVPTAIPVNPSDPIALVNGETITRRELADECIARKGQEILETLIARRLIEQAMRKRKIEVTPAEIDQEIETVAQRMAGIGREAWLRTLDKERGISPVQYARDIIFPTLALRKLTAGRVQVTEEDIKSAMEANFGPRLYCRIITVDRQPTAIEIWEKLRQNPAGFEKIAKERSTDSATRALGGLLTEPIARHAFPLTVSKPAFAQLVDGETSDKDPTHKPKDGDFTGPIQVNDACWIIVKRERVEPGRDYDPKNKDLRDHFYAQMYEVKIKEAMAKVFEELSEAAAIDNRLSGVYKESHETRSPDAQDIRDREVRLMGGQAATSKAPPRSSATPSAARPSATPVGVSPEVAEQANRLSRPIAKPQP